MLRNIMLHPIKNFFIVYLHGCDFRKICYLLSGIIIAESVVKNYHEGVKNL